MKIDINDLYGVKGIGDKTIERIKEQFREKEKQSKTVKNFDPIKIDNAELYYGDCLDVMDYLIDKNIKVDAIITDPPYGTTACKWDSVIPFDEMWGRLKFLRRDNTPIVLFGSEPFSSALRFSNIKEYKYDWTWNKIQGVGHLVAKYRPMQNTEIISVFGKGKINYYPQMTKKNKPMFSDERTGKRTDICGGKISNNYKGKLNTHSHPVTTLNYKKPSNTIRVHPTQKPVDLLEYLIKTYTNEGDIILDFTMGSGTTGVAAKNLNRKFIGIELEKEYFDISIKRLKGEIA